MVEPSSSATDLYPVHDLNPSNPTDWIDEMLKEAFHKAQGQPPLRLADILHEIVSTLTRYVHFPQPAIAMLIACWIAMTYCFREFRYSGYLAIRSQGPQSGKTRLLELLSALSGGNPSIYTSPTAAVLYRANQDVFLIDEVDRLRAQDRQTYGQVIGILNAGFASNGVVPRAARVDDNGRFVVVNHPVYGPKAFAGLEKLEDTLADRCFHIQMRKAPTRLTRWSMRSFDATAARIREQLKSWFTANHEQVGQAYAGLPNELHVLRRYDDRYQDIAEPLIVLAALADAENGGVQTIMPALLAGLCLGACQRGPTGGVRLAMALEDILRPIVGDGEAVSIPTKDLLQKVQAGGLGWIDSPHDMAKALSPFGLHPRSNGTLHEYYITREIVENLTKPSGVNSALGAWF